jgi:hypothetical protein
MIETICLHCGNRKVVDKSHTGRTFKCPECENPVKVESIVNENNVIPQSQNISFAAEIERAEEEKKRKEAAEAKRKKEAAEKKRIEDERFNIKILFFFAVGLLILGVYVGADSPLLGLGMFGFGLWQLFRWRNKKRTFEKDNYVSIRQKIQTVVMSNMKYIVIIGILVSILVAGILYFTNNNQQNNYNVADSTTSTVDTVTAAGSKEETAVTEENEATPVPIIVQTVESSGEYVSNNKYYTAASMVDGKLNTWWTPNPSNGVQSYAKFFLVGNPFVEISSMKIINGSYGRYYYDNSRITKLKVSFDDGQYEIFTLSDNQEFQHLFFTEKHETNSVQIELLDRIMGNTWDDVCISEIQFFK